MKPAFITFVLLILPLVSQVSGQAVFARQKGKDGKDQKGNGNKNDNKNNNNNAGGNGNNAGNNNNAGGNNNNAGGNNGTAATGGNNGTAATGGNNGTAANGDPQTSLTLDPAVIAKGFANDGQSTPSPGQVPSLTSTNNFINFCLTVPNLPITNGQQVQGGSCNPAPMGVIPSVDKMPSAKFVNPKNGDTIAASQAFQIQMAINNLATGNFVNAQQNYFSAPQQVNAQGLITGHSHVVVEQLTSLSQTTPLDPTKFAFFKGLNAAAQNGVLTADVTNGLPAGDYRLCSINTAANHQPALVPVAQHGSLDDCVYFTASAGGAAGNGAATGAGGATATTGATTTTAGAGDAGTATTTAVANTATAGSGGSAGRRRAIFA